MRSAFVLLAASLIACGDNRAPAAVKDATGNHDDDAATACVPTRGTAVATRQIGSVGGIAVLATSPPNDPRLFVVVREGQIRIFSNEQLVARPFIDLSSVIYDADTTERGLLGLAFHPAFASNRLFFVYYTTSTNCVVARCSVSDDPNVANPTCTPILDVLHDTAGNHNGGMIEFGRDGYLYIGTGDGGGEGDAFGHAQAPTSLLGKILRIDVDHKAAGSEYGIPADNPYASGGGAPEVFIRGLRNPWRWSFDRVTGDMWIGDVGQARSEELDVLHPSEQNGANLGWNMYEGLGCCATQDDHCTETAPTPCAPTGITFPKDSRDRETPRGTGWAAIVGGQSYYGTCYPDLFGYHFYTDVYAGVLVRAILLADDTLSMTDLPEPIPTQFDSIHDDSRGELYLTATDGTVYHLEAGP